MSESPASHPNDDGAEDGFAGALIRARSELGLTQAQVAEVSGISRSAIKGYESGRNMPGARELRGLCRVLKVSPTTLLYGSEAAFHDQAGTTPAHQGFDRMRAHFQLLALSQLLPVDELEALTKLMRAIAIARHGADTVHSRLALVSEGAVKFAGPNREEALRDVSEFVDALDADAAAANAAAQGRDTQKSS